MIGPWPPREVGVPQEPAPVKSEADVLRERLALVEQVASDALRSHRPEPYAVFSSPLGRLFNLKPSRW